jgi:hypothetical protein
VYPFLQVHCDPNEREELDGDEDESEELDEEEEEEKTG